MKTEKWLKLHTHDLTGKTVAITGSTGGLGTKLCLYLAGLNANLLMLNRSESKTNALKAEILAAYPNAQIEFLQLDQTDFANLKNVCDELKNRTIDFLVLNAGAYNIPVRQTELGFNNIFQINFFSPYYLVKELLPSLRKNHGKVVVVGSLAHRFAHLDETDVDYSKRKAARKIYGNSKRFLMFSLFELFKNETECSLSIAHPGITLTNMTNHYPKAINWFVKFGVKVVFPSPQRAVLNVVDALFLDCGCREWIGPRVCGIWGLPKKRKLRSCSSSESEKIFQIAEQTCRGAN